MVYTEFSTQSANYVVSVGNPLIRYLKGIDVRIFHGIDALVLGLGSETSINGGSLSYEHNTVEYCKQNEIPIYFVDSKLTFYGSVRDLTSSLPKDIFFSIFIFYDLTGKRVNGQIRKLYSNFAFAIDILSGNKRDALFAKKIEEFVVGDIQKHIDKKKPRIGILSDGYLTLEDYLLDESRRNSVLNRKGPGVKMFPSYTTEDTTQVFILRPPSYASERVSI